MTNNQLLSSILPVRMEGRVSQTTGTTAAVNDFPVPVGARVDIESQLGIAIPAEVIGFSSTATLVYPLGNMAGVRRGNRVRLRRTAACLKVGKPLLGRVVDSDARPIDGKSLPMLPDRVPRDRLAPTAL
ncbi:MAG: hypothetical protein N2C12_05230, partial [Planctomycetales bacterium]